MRGIPRRSAIVALLVAGAGLDGCVAGSGAQVRAAPSSLECMQQAVAAHVPAGIPDGQAHCLAAAFIARECSTAEAWLAGYGKELGDLLGGGDAELRDLAADRAGVHCARGARRDEDVETCCLGRFAHDRVGVDARK